MSLLTGLEGAVQDLRYGARDLAKNRVFTATVLLSLALGIMATTSMYSVIYGVVLEPFPYKDVDQLVSIAVRTPQQRGWRGGYSVDEYVELARRATIFEGVAASTISDVLWMENGEPRRLRGNHISGNGFDVMCVPAMLGRTVTAAEADPETKAVLGYRFWVRQFGGDPSILGAKLVLNGRARTVVGVMPPRFMFRGADVYLPLDYHASEEREGVANVNITARRKPGVTAAQAEADLTPILSDLARRYPARYPPQWRVELISFKETFPSGIREVLWIMFGAVGLLLLISCANVSNLLLARASARQREIAMRAALGAGRLRLFRQLLTESLVIGLVGGAAGVLLSWAGLKAILAVVPPGVIPDESEVVLNLPVLLFSLALSLATTLLFGLAPALHAAWGELAFTLKEAGRGAGGGRRMGWLRGGLVVVELSLAIVLLAGAGLFLHTLLAWQHAAQTVGVDNRLILRLPLSAERYPSPERRAAFAGELLERVNAMPGVLAASINSGVHPVWSWNFPVVIPGAPESDKRPVAFHQVDARYLAATGIGLLRGAMAGEGRRGRAAAGDGGEPDVRTTLFLRRRGAGQDGPGPATGEASLRSSRRPVRDCRHRAGCDGGLAERPATGGDVCPLLAHRAGRYAGGSHGGGPDAAGPAHSPAGVSTGWIAVRGRFADAGALPGPVCVQPRAFPIVADGRFRRTRPDAGGNRRVRAALA